MLAGDTCVALALTAAVGTTPTELLVALDSLHYQPGSSAASTAAAGHKHGSHGSHAAGSSGGNASPGVVVVGITSGPNSVDDTLAACFVAPGGKAGAVAGRPATGGRDAGAPRAAGRALYVPLPSKDMREEVLLTDLCHRSAALSVPDMEALVKWVQKAGVAVQCTICWALLLSARLVGVHVQGLGFCCDAILRCHAAMPLFTLVPSAT